MTEQRFSPTDNSPEASDYRLKSRRKYQVSPTGRVVSAARLAEALEAKQAAQAGLHHTPDAIEHTSYLRGLITKITKRWFVKK